MGSAPSQSGRIGRKSGQIAEKVARFRHVIGPFAVRRTADLNSGSSHLKLAGSPLAKKTGAKQL